MCPRDIRFPTCRDGWSFNGHGGEYKEVPRLRVFRQGLLFIIREYLVRDVSFFTTNTEWVIMIERTVSRGLLFLGLLFLLVAPAIADLTTIYQGNTVFIGEQNLNIANAMGTYTQIGWWASGAAITTTSPAQLVSATSPFSVAPSTFGSYTGVWYRLTPQGKPDGVAFIVADPSLDIRVEDTTVNVDVTNKWVPRGDDVRFRIDTNLNAISTQRGTPVPITIKVQSPNGGVFSALVNEAGTPTPLENIGVTTSPFYYLSTPIWDTGNSLYPAGSYTIWAECDANSMKDNYDVTGKTISEQTSLLDQDQNPLISVNVPTTNPTTHIATTSPTPTPLIVTTAIATIPSTSPTYQIATSPSVAATAAPVATISTSLTSVETTSTKSGGFGAVLTMISLCSFAAVVILKKQL